jgi:glycosyltransferase involved in cell wall biosynthesis
MKVLVIHNDYARYSGEESACESIAALLVENGHDVVWYRRSSAELGGAPLSMARAALSGIHSPLACHSVAKLVKRESPDVALVQNLYPLISASVLRVLRSHGVPVVMRCPNYRVFCPNGLLFSHGSACESCMGWGRELWCVIRNCEGFLPKSIAYALRNAVSRLGKRYLRGVDQFVVLTAFQRDFFARSGISASQLSIVPNMIDHELVPPAEERSADIIGYVGRLAPEKGFEDFVEAARRLPHLRFGAAGAVKEGYEHVVEKLPENLTWHGFLDGAALRKFIAGIEVFVTCSRWFEGFPNTIVLNMSAGNPVVATAVGGVPEIVEDGVSGLLYAPGDVDSLSRHIAILADDATSRNKMGDAGRARAERYYSRSAVYSALVEVLQTAAGVER